MYTYTLPAATERGRTMELLTSKLENSRGGGEALELIVLPAAECIACSHLKCGTRKNARKFSSIPIGFVTEMRSP